jgi:hypothetical protein
MRVCGIDSGATGCIVVLDSEECTAKYMFLPYRKDKILDIRKIYPVFDFEKMDRILVEKVHARGGFQASTNGAMGRYLGHVEIMLFFYPVNYIVPTMWQKNAHVGASGITAKEKSLYNFDKLNPNYGGIKTSHNGLADAFFIARYGLDCLRCRYRDDWNFIDLG